MDRDIYKYFQHNGHLLLAVCATRNQKMHRFVSGIVKTANQVSYEPGGCQASEFMGCCKLFCTKYKKPCMPFYQCEFEMQTPIQRNLELYTFTI